MVQGLQAGVATHIYFFFFTHFLTCHATFILVSDVLAMTNV